MLSVLKRLFSKSTATPASPPPAPAAAPPPAASASASSMVAPPPADGIAVSLKSVAGMLPDVLKKRLDRQLTGKEVIYITRGEALRQLPTGSVKMQFSELVRQAPNTFLSPDQDMLVMMINLPLQEILPHIKTLPRRSAQRHVEVPQDLAPVFGTGSEQSREVKPSTPPPQRTGSRPSPPPPETSDGPLSIPAPAPKPIPPPAPKPIPPPQPIPIPVAATPPPAYTPPPSKLLDEQKPISFTIPKAEPIAPAPPAPAPITPISPIVPTVEAKPTAPPPPAFTSPPPAPVAASPESALGFGDVFGQPQKTDWTPQEVVEKAATLRGVAGALITTIDGLPVAFHLPANLSGNAVAAFVPQMYTRITQYTRDLKLGDAKHLTILIESVPLQIFKAGNVYFTALGKANENLPKPQLTAIAAALGRQSQT